MAIKGKSKSRSAKAVTRGPKPAYVTVKKPILARRGFWIGAACVAAILLIAGLWYGFARQASEDREREEQEAMAEAASAYTEQLDPILAAVGEPVAPVGFSSFPAFHDALTQLGEDSADAPADAEAIATVADDTLEAAESALEALDGIDESALLQGEGLPEEFVLYVINSKGNLVRSMRLYAEAAKLLRAAAQADGPERAALLARARGVADVAGELATRSNSDLVEAQVRAGTFDPGAVPALPLPTGPTGA